MLPSVSYFPRRAPSGEPNRREGGRPRAVPVLERPILVRDTRAARGFEPEADNRSGKRFPLLGVDSSL